MLDWILITQTLYTLQVTSTQTVSLVLQSTIDMCLLAVATRFEPSSEADRYGNVSCSKPISPSDEVKNYYLIDVNTT